MHAGVCICACVCVSVCLCDTALLNGNCVITKVRAASWTASDSSCCLPSSCAYCSTVTCLPSQVDASTFASAPATMSAAMISAGQLQSRACANGANWTRTSHVSHQMNAKCIARTFCRDCQQQHRKQLEAVLTYCPCIKPSTQSDSHK